MARRRTWTDDDLIAAIDGARSWNEVKRRLGLRGGGSAEPLRRRCEQLGLDTSALPERGQTWRSWTDEDLRQAVASAANLRQVFLLLEVSVGGRAWVRMQEHILRLQLDTSHWDDGAVQPGGSRAAPPRLAPAIDDEELRAVLPEVETRAELARRLGLEPRSGSVQRRLRERIEHLGLPDDHLRGQGWARGRVRPRRRRPLDEVLVKGARHRGSWLRQRLVEEGVLAPRCSGCGLDRWRDQPAPLQLDHIDGDPTNNLRENLRLLCPNCHAQTETYCGRNKGNR